MTDMVIPPEALEAAARGMFAEEQCDKRQRQDIEGNWNSRLNDEDHAEYRALATAALEAALPHLRPMLELAGNLGRALGRKEAGEEMAAAFEAFFPDPHTETEACGDCMVVHEFAAIARNIAAREIATKEPK